MMRRFSVAFTLGSLAVITVVQAQTGVRVSQESSPGAGDFDDYILGVIEVFDQSDLSVSEVYQYDNPVAYSYNGVITPALSDTTQLFFVNTSEGLSLFVLHDEPDSEGGRAQMSFELSDDPDGAARLLEDDPSDMFRPGNDFGPFLFRTHHWWSATLFGTTTDGVVIGTLEGPWSLLAAFTDVDGDPGNEIVGLTGLLATSAVDDPIPLALEVDRRIRLEPFEDVGLEATIDIKPGSDPNSINCRNEKGVVTVAILTTLDFEATAVDHTTVVFEGAYETHVNRKTGMARRHEEDVDADGDIDLVLHFRFGDTRLTCESTEATLMGEMFDGTEFQATGEVRMVQGPKVIKIR